MPSLKATKKRIVSVKNTQKITNAMQLVAASKFSKSLEKSKDVKQYGAHLDAMLSRCIKDASPAALYPYLLPGHGSSLVDTSSDTESSEGSDSSAKSATSLLVVMASDRGLCGSLNAQIIKQALEVISGAHEGKDVSKSNSAPGKLAALQHDKLMAGLMDQGYFESLSSSESQSAENTENWEVFLWGKKSWSLEKSFAKSAQSVRPHVFLKESFVDSMMTEVRLRALKDILVEKFFTGQWRRVVLVRSQFESALVQQACFEHFLPLSLDQLVTSVSQASDDPMGSTISPLWEPQASDLVKLLIDKKLEVMLHQAVLESLVCEHAARMTAMDSATQNAGDVIKNLTLEYNRARQAAITTELVEITSGAVALSSS